MDNGKSDAALQKASALSQAAVAASRTPERPPRLRDAARSILTGRQRQNTDSFKRKISKASSKDPWSNAIAIASHQAPSPRSTSVQLTPKGTLAQLVHSHKMKTLVRQAKISTKWNSRAPTAPNPDGQSTVMTSWLQKSRAHASVSIEGDDEVFVSSENDLEAEFDGTNQYPYATCRVSSSEDICRRALMKDGDDRTASDLQSIKAWFQQTKLKITNDFDKLKAHEVERLCRQMNLISYNPKDFVFQQGDEGDALYVVYSGTFEACVSQRILGERVEVTVSELTNGDFFGERALLTNDVRAATIVAKDSAEAVRITRADYDLILRQDQQAFVSRIQLASGFKRSANINKGHREYTWILSKEPRARSSDELASMCNYLQTLRFFRSLPKAFVQELCHVISLVELPANSYVFREGDVGDRFYIIFTGSVDVIVNNKEARGSSQSTKLITLKEGSHFGELALLKSNPATLRDVVIEEGKQKEGGKRSATVITREDSQLLVMSEQDYNNSLRRLQKQELARRVAVLDKIGIFQSSEWTTELLEELSYVLTEQRLVIGSTLFQQGDRAQHLYFVVRGELEVTKRIVDPRTSVPTAMVIGRVGRYQVIGDDAAAGATFNETIYREVTVTTSTPVHVLLLSKYDVFHRLSTAARETLRAVAQAHPSNLVYADRLLKSRKWEAFKRKTLKEHLNYSRLEQLLPIKAESNKNTNKTAKSKAEREGRDEERIKGMSKNELVDGDDYLLVSPKSKSIASCFPSGRTLVHHVATFNADAPISPARKKQLRMALTTEMKSNKEVISEGNPLTYLDPQRVFRNEEKQQERPNSTSRRRSSTASGRMSDLTATSVSSKVDVTQKQIGGKRSMTDFFLFSAPTPPSDEQQEGRPQRAGRTFVKDISHCQLPTRTVLTDRYLVEFEAARSITQFCIWEIYDSEEGGRTQCAASDKIDSVVLDIGTLYPLQYSMRGQLTNHQANKVQRDGLGSHAVASIILSKQQTPQAACACPSLCIHGIYPSYTQAANEAMSRKALPSDPQNALTCVFPTQKWLNMDDAFDWVVRVEPSKQSNSRPVAQTKIARMKTTSRLQIDRKSSCRSHLMSNPSNQMNGLSSRRLSKNSATSPDCNEKQRATMIRKLVYSRMGLPSPLPAHDERIETNGYSAQPTATLEAKLATLQDILNLQRREQSNGRIKVLEKSVNQNSLASFQNVRRFGKLLKSRIDGNHD